MPIPSLFSCQEAVLAANGGDATNSAGAGGAEVTPSGGADPNERRTCVAPGDGPTVRTEGVEISGPAQLWGIPRWSWAARHRAELGAGGPRERLIGARRAGSPRAATAGTAYRDGHKRETAAGGVSDTSWCARERSHRLPLRSKYTRQTATGGPVAIRFRSAPPRAAERKGRALAYRRRCIPTVAQVLGATVCSRVWNTEDREGSTESPETLVVLRRVESAERGGGFCPLGGVPAATHSNK